MAPVTWQAGRGLGDQKQASRDEDRKKGTEEGRERREGEKEEEGWERRKGRREGEMEGGEEVRRKAGRDTAGIEAAKAPLGLLLSAFSLLQL